jgi:mannose-6-phosphate isomerase-like protein (cupin superfamily)
MTTSRTPAHTLSPAEPSAVSYGTTIYFETVGPSDGRGATLRIRPDEDTLVRVIHGTLRLTIDNVERLLAPGGEAIVRAGRPHRLSGVGGEARFMMGFRTAATLR